MPAIVCQHGDGAVFVPSPFYYPQIVDYEVTQQNTATPTYNLPTVRPEEYLLMMITAGAVGHTWSFDQSPDEDEWHVNTNGAATAWISNFMGWKKGAVEDNGGSISMTISGGTTSTICHVFAIAGIGDIADILDEGPVYVQSSTINHPAIDLPELLHYTVLAMSCNWDDRAGDADIGSGFTKILENLFNSTEDLAQRTYLREVLYGPGSPSFDPPNTHISSSSFGTRAWTIALKPTPDKALLEEEGVDLPLVNPGGETGDTTGWVLDSNTLQATTAQAHSGSWSLRADTATVSDTIAHQDVPIPSDYWDAVDEGRVRANVSWYDNNPSGNDSGRINLRFVDDESPENILVGEALGTYTSAAGWISRTLTGAVPPGCRAIRVELDGLQGDLTGISFFWDDITLALDVYTDLAASP